MLFYFKICNVRHFPFLFVIHLTSVYAEILTVSACPTSAALLLLSYLSFFTCLYFHFDLSFFLPSFCHLKISLPSIPTRSLFPTHFFYLPSCSSLVFKHSFTNFLLFKISESALALCPCTHLCLSFECFQRPIKQHLGRTRNTHLTPEDVQREKVIVFPYLCQTHTQTYTSTQKAEGSHPCEGNHAFYSQTQDIGTCKHATVFFFLLYFKN